jgi:biopolymer transport protein TolQ
LATVFEDVYAAYKRQTGGSGLPLNMIALERTAQNAASEAVMALERRMTWWAMMIALERTAQSAASEAVTALERRMTWLATIGSVSPFVGLFGTVMGVVDAFLGLGQAGSGTLRAVAPGIAESLLTTAAGLFVAVPAVIAYNQFMARIRVFASATDDFSRELLNSLGNVPAPPPRSD